MKIKPILIVIALLIAPQLRSQDRQTYPEGYLVKVGDMAPVFTVNEAGGKSYSLSALRGKVVMLQFTASWCSVCRKEMPFIEKEIWQPWKSKGLMVIGIDRDEPSETVNDFAKTMGISYPLALDPGADIFGLYALKEAGVTRNIIIDRTGEIAFVTRLFDRKEFDAMKGVISGLLSEK